MIVKEKLLILALSVTRPVAEVINGKPDFFTDDLLPPVAYYYFNDGSGSKLKESVTDNPNAGVVLNDNNEKPNWIDDTFFDKTIACGKIDGDSVQKDTLSLEDIDYGSTGSWAWSIWFRHAESDFPGSSREQFLGHGDPLEIMTSRNQVHVQFETDGIVRSHVYDTTDVDRFVYSDQTDERFPEQTDPLCYREKECRITTLAYADTDKRIGGYDDGQWHHLVLTTRPDSTKGYSVYIDGVLRSSSPFVKGVGTDLGFGNCDDYVNCKGLAGNPIDPIGPIRLCGRAKPADWSGGEGGEYAWDPERYFHGQVAHFAVWDSALSVDQIISLQNAYVAKYNLVIPKQKHHKKSGKAGKVIGIAIGCAATISLLAVGIWYRRGKVTEKAEFSSNGQSMT